jgi:hypothetical protein
MTEEDALLTIVNWFRSGSPGGFSNYGYDLYLPNVIRWYLIEEKPELRGSSMELEPKVPPLFPFFANAAWELCRRGILRPGVKAYNTQSTNEGSAGSGFSVTTFGKQWLSESEGDIFIPTEPERFAKMLEPFKERFGPGFHERAQQAVRCYGAHAYLACCAMCGAAAESVLLATAIAKTKDEPRVLKNYASAGGRVRVENMVVGQCPENLKREFRGLTELLKYWRDEAAHGKASGIGDYEAYTSLAVVLRYALFISSNWDQFIAVD